MNKVKYYRLISGLLLKDLSEKTGLSVGHLSHIENGNKQPSKSAMESISISCRKYGTRSLLYAAYGRRKRRNGTPGRRGRQWLKPENRKYLEVWTICL